MGYALEELESFRKYLELSKSPNTAKSYLYSVRKFMEYLNTKGKTVKDATLHDIVEFLSGFGKRYSARHAYALKLFFKYIGREELAMKIPVPRYTISLPDWLDEETIMTGINTLKEIAENTNNNLNAYRDLIVIWLSYEAALRIGELVLLNKDDFKPDEKEIIVHRLKTKGGEPEDHAVPLSDELTEAIKTYLSLRNDDCKALIVCGEPPHRCSKEMIRLIFKKFAKLIGRPEINFHILRHSRLTHLAMRGVDITTLAKLAHHKNPASTLIYVHLSSKYLRERIERDE